MASIFFHEARAVLSSLPRSVYYIREEEPITYKGTALVLSGWLGPELFYQLFRHHLRELGMRTIFLSRGYSIVSQITRPHRQFRENLAGLLRSVGSVDYIFGHSLGGIEALSILPRMRGVRKAFIIKPPLEVGISQRKMRIYRMLGVVPHSLDPRRLDSIIRKARPHQDRLITISAETDWLCPARAHKYFPQAKNYVVDEGHSEGELFAHASLSEAPQVIEIIKQELLLA